MKYNCCIVEDELPARELVETYIKSMPDLEIKASISSWKELMKLDLSTVDLLILDIQLHKNNSFEWLRQHNQGIPVIVTTAFSEYALEGYELNVKDYLLKPYSFERFKIAVEKAIESKGLTYIVFKSGYEHKKIAMKEIHYFQSYGEYVKLFLLGSKSPIILSHSMTEVEQMVSNKYLLRIHRSYIVSISSIQSIRSTEVYLSNGKSLPVGRKYRDSIKQL